MMEFIRWRSFSSGCVCLLLFVAFSEAVDTNSRGRENVPVSQTFVDGLIAEYVGIERMLWQRIENRADNILLQVYKNHETFYERVLAMSGSGAISRDLIPNLETLKNLEANINSTAELGQTHLTEQILDRNDIVDYANTALKILKDADNLFEYAIKYDLWETIISNLTQCYKSGDTVQSSHQVIYDFYRDIQSDQLKSYVTAQMSYMILKYYNNNQGNYDEDVDSLRSTFSQRFIKLREVVRKFLKKANRNVWRCDTVVNNVYTTHTEIINFLQGSVDNEANLNPSSTCTATCSDYRATQHYQCQSGSLCDRNVNDHEPAKCGGILRDCRAIDESDLTICETGDANRRYNYIKYDDGRTAGNSNGVCHGRLRAESWLRWFVRCSNCLCLCDDNRNKRSERFFSLREVVSNIADNKIVTGVVFTKQNGVIHLAIAERTLLPFGQAEIMHSFYEPWKSSYEFFHIDDTDIQPNVDYVALSYENRSIDLNSVRVPQNYLVTGVRFRIAENGHIALDVRATKFDFTTGRLKDPQNSRWISNRSTDRTEIKLDKPHNPLHYLKNMTQLNATPNAFITFGPTDYWNDVSQLTVPFIDTQRNEPYNPIPLAGVGVFHKAVPGSGGFIAPKLIVYDFESHILN